MRRSLCIWSIATVGLGLYFAFSSMATAQITAPGTDYPTFWSGELRIFAQAPDTRVTLINLDDESLFALPGDSSPDPRLFGGPCYIIAADGSTTDAPSNPFVLRDRGSMFRCTGGIGGPDDEIRVRVLSDDATGGGTLSPVTIWTGSKVVDRDNSWGSFLPGDLHTGDTFGREIGTDFVGFTQSEAIVIAPRVPGLTTSLSIVNLDSGVSLALDLDTSVPPCPPLVDADPPIAPSATPCYLHDGAELQVLYDGNYSDDRIFVSSNVNVSVLTGHRLLGFVPDDMTINHHAADWTVTPPSWSPGDDGVELGTVFYTFARQALTIFPTEHDTTVEIIDLSDADDSRTLFLEHGDILNPKDPATLKLSLFTSILDTRLGSGIVARAAEPTVDLVTAGENPFDNDILKIVSDKPILVYQGPAGSDVNEFADVAFSVAIGPQERLVYCYSQNSGGSNDFQLFSFPGDSKVTVASLSYTRDFGAPVNHDFLVDFSETDPVAVTTWPVHDVFVSHGVPGGIQHFGSGVWFGELLVVRSERPMTVISGDYDGVHFGAYVPFIPTSRELPPVARLSADSAASCFGSAFTLSAAGSFDQDPEGSDPQIVEYLWEFGDGSSLSTTDSEVSHIYTEPGVFNVTLTVTDNEGDIDTDFMELTVFPLGTPGCEQCAPCEGKVSELTMRYDGFITDVHVQVFSKKSSVPAFDGSVQPGMEFSFVGSDKKGTLGPEITMWIDGVLNTKIHTSCSEPIGAGDKYGDFTILSGRSRIGGLLCPLGADVGDSHTDRDKGKKKGKNSKNNRPRRGGR